jgi:uncharacterized protein YdaU (DUF1376 family)
MPNFRSPLFMRFWLNDFESATCKLSALAQAAWINLTVDCVRRGGYLPNDDKALARLARLDLSQWQSIREEIEDAFDIGPQGWTNTFAQNALADIESRRQRTAKARVANPNNNPTLRAGPLNPDAAEGHNYRDTGQGGYTAAESL